MHHLGNRQQPLYTCQVDPEFVHQVLDQAQPLELFARIQPHAADGARRLNQSEPLVLAQRLRMHPQTLRRHADEIQILIDRHTAHSLAESYQRTTLHDPSLGLDTPRVKVMSRRTSRVRVALSLVCESESRRQSCATETHHVAG